jgi:hypothetical protein
MEDMIGRDATGIGIANSAILGRLFDRLLKNKVLSEADIAAILRNALSDVAPGMNAPAVQAREIITEFNTRVTKTFKKNADEN